MGPILVSSVLLFSFPAFPESLTEVSPSTAGLPATFTNTLDTILETAVTNREIAGAEALVLLGDSIVYRGTSGFIQKIPQPVPMRRDTLFDLASLTKVVVTTTCLMKLVERGQVSLDDPVAEYLSEFDRKGYRGITLKNLLTHTSGLPPLAGFYRRYRGKVIYLRHLFDHPLRNPPGEKRVYSDTGFMVAGWVIEKVVGMGLDRFAKSEIFDPLGMNRTYFNPPYGEWTGTAATELCSWREKVMRGEVHDENAFALGGVAGHAGLFSTVSDLAVFCRMLLQGGEWNGVRILEEKTVREIRKPQGLAGNRFQGLGWWIQENRDQKLGSLISPETFGHTGFTGTSLWMDPEYDLAVILLTNAIHPRREQAERTPVRRAFHHAVRTAVEGLHPPDGEG